MNETHPSIEQIVDYLHGALSPAEDAAMHAHLAGCPPCGDRRAEEVALTEALRSQAVVQERELPPGVVARIRERVEQPAAAPVWLRAPASLRPAFIVSAAAAIAAIVYFGTGARHGTPPSTAIGAAYYVENHDAMAAAAPFADDAPPTTLTSDDETR